MSVEARGATLPNHQRPSRALYQSCAPASRAEELNEAVKPEGAWYEAVHESEEDFFPGTVIVRGERPRCASGGISGWSDGAVKGCPTNSGGCGVGEAVDLIRVPKTC